jgi:hypothetical protein
VDSKQKIIHSAVVTATHVADCTMLPELLHGEQTKVWGDQAYRGQTEVIREVAPMAQDMTSSGIAIKVASISMKSSGRRAEISRACGRRWNTSSR